MRILVITFIICATIWWICWELRPPNSFAFPVYDQAPAVVLIRQTAATVALAAALLALAAALDRGIRPRVIMWSRDVLFWLQGAVGACAGVTGVYNFYQLLRIRETLRSWPDSPELNAQITPVVALALVPWPILAATIAFAVASTKGRGALTLAIIAFDLLAVVVLAMIFGGIGHWACFTCSGPGL
jgi:hypothetical protein